MPQRSTVLTKTSELRGHSQLKYMFPMLNQCLIYSANDFQTFLRSSEREIIWVRILEFLNTLTPIQLDVIFNYILYLAFIVNGLRQ